MFRVTRYPMISKNESGRVGYRKKYRVVGRVRVPAGHCKLEKKTFWSSVQKFIALTFEANFEILASKDSI